MSLTCVIHHGEVDEADTVELPNGPVCIRCYSWMEDIMDGDDGSDDDGVSYTIVIELDDDEDDE